MRNTITKNGVLSSTLSGLLISELPAITKPARRQDITLVDGRDGDVVSYLGYETYKKSMQIGLYGSYDIDAISNFLNGEGWFTFSNEPTKRYRGRIVDNIDYERLVRFRTAKVDIIVQPYKKLVTEADVTGTASPLTVHNSGYETCLPKFVISAAAAATIVLKVGGVTKMTITMPPEGTITIDGEAKNCYNSNADKNQYVVGTFIELPSGDSVISWTGTVTAMTITPNSRFL